MGLLVLAGVQAAAKIPHSGNEVINNAYCGYPLDITSLWQKEDTMLKISMSNKFQFRMMPEFRGLIWPQRSGDIHYIGGAEILPAPFTIDEEKEILDKLGGLDDQAARSSLIEHNLRLVVYIAKKFENSGINKLANDFTRISGNIITGRAIPFIIPYFERDSLQCIPLFSKLDGIINCLKVDSPDLIYEVIAIGIEIRNIL